MKMRLAILLCFVVALIFAEEKPDLENNADHTDDKDGGHDDAEGRHGNTEGDDDDRDNGEGGNPWIRPPGGIRTSFRCGPPPKVENGVVSRGNDNLTATRPIICNPSYSLSGHSMIVCTKTGWSKPGSCKPTSNRFFLVRDRMTWYNAVVRCNDLGARLAMPKTIIDNAVIIHLMKRLKTQLAWIGLTRMNSNSNTWQWVDGSKLDPDNYQGWLPGEPNLGLEGCAQFHILDQVTESSEHPQLYGWNDFFCAHNRTRIGRTYYDVGAICEKVELTSINN